MRVEDLIIDRRYIIDGKGRIGVYKGVNPDTGGVRFEVAEPHPYIEQDGLVGFAIPDLIEPETI
jgi:hypothetical protein